MPDLDKLDASLLKSIQDMLLAGHITQAEADKMIAGIKGGGK